MLSSFSGQGKLDNTGAGRHHSGVFTPTEAGAVGCSDALFAIASANLLAWLMASVQIPAVAAEAISQISGNQFVFLLLVNILFLFIGSLLDTSAAIVIIVPILEPIALSMGIDPIHLGAVIVVNFVIGYITAPLGHTLFVAKSITGRGMGEVSMSVMPFLAVCLLGSILVT